MSENKTDLIAKHKAWMGKRILCSSCGCSGNNDCGHECIDADKGCTLNEAEVCPCCSAVWKAENLKR